ncbi:MAG: hypothetical protein DHS20C18_06930 [Saprospiraceae bacterium]|nr:MAG: hypothetical protein DHS20C18_06930 [Saprospiraceae bacterium]
MASQALFSILALPQEYNAGNLRFNLVFIPRNFSPLQNLGNSGFPDVGAFADAGANLRLDVKIIAGLAGLPDNANVTFSDLLETVAVPNSARPIFEHLQTEFKIDDIANASQKAPGIAPHRFIKKYLPLSYRRSFNFTNPRTKDAVVDDSYHCAFKDSGINPAFKQSSNRISWGKVYAYCLRHPEVAQQTGLIYNNLTIEVPENIFENGGWLYVDFANQGYFSDKVLADDKQANRYAARIPAMAANDSRILFAPVLFPVAYSVPISGNFDEVQREAADYDDGFAKIIHSFQPITTNFLQEEASQEMLCPTKDIGIRLAWDDEQMLIWLNRQLKPDASVPGNERLDVPLGVFNYRIDVREKQDDNNPWHSLNTVRPKQNLVLGGQTIMTPESEIELGTEVYPMQLDGNQNANYWLPAYFTQWAGKSLVLTDEDAAAIYRTEEETRTYVDGDGATQKLQVQLSKQYDPVGLDQVPLIYGHQYQFRIRMGDISGGGPGVNDSRIFEAISKDTSVTFKRYVAPNAVRMEDLPENNNFFTGASLALRRPLLDYPNVAFTNQYQDVVNKLIAYANWATGKSEIGLPDPDVNRVEITVEIKALLMDNQLSVSGRESYNKLYTTIRNFNALDFAAAVDNDPNAADPLNLVETPLQVPIEFIDAAVLRFGDPNDLGDLKVTEAELAGLPQIILPRGRDIRITLRGLGADDDTYFGMDAWAKGKTIQLMVRGAAEDERQLFDPAFEDDQIEGVYLQPSFALKPRGRSYLLGRAQSTANLSVQKLAKQTNLESRGLSLLGEEGVRVQFGCTRNIRHSLAPDGTSLTFSVKTDLYNHWLVPINLRLQRDWTWNATELEGFVITRRKKFGRANNWGAEEEVGIINLHNTINLQALQKPDRTYTQLVFIDAVEPKPDPTAPGASAFPDIIEVQYSVTPKFKAGEIPVQTTPEENPLALSLTLPVTTIPAQEPKLVSAGIALSPYQRDDHYANTEARKRYLWIELEEPVKDPNDRLFIRFLAYAPDPLLADLARYPELLEAAEEPDLPIDPELIRIIRPNQSDDNAGLSAMTGLIPANTEANKKPRHFLVPLPPGLHPESDELFGFFTYELRIGHSDIWSTAQGRFGRPLRVTGVQHPTPTLFCTVERGDHQIKVVAPYATAVQNGKNVTARPPRTEIWCLLYAQVKMADNQDYRNILLGEAKLNFPRRSKPPLGVRAYEVSFQENSNKDGRIYGSLTFNLKDILAALAGYGLPLDSPLSVVCVELLPTDYRPIATRNQAALQYILKTSAEELFENKKIELSGITFQDNLQERPDNARPLSDHLGEYRIMRVSPLTEVPEICCVDC